MSDANAAKRFREALLYAISYVDVNCPYWRLDCRTCFERMNVES